MKSLRAKDVKRIYGGCFEATISTCVWAADKQNKSLLFKSLNNVKKIGRQKTFTENAFFFSNESLYRNSS